MDTANRTDRMYWWDKLGHRDLASNDLAPRTSLDDGTIEIWSGMFRRVYLLDYDGCDQTDNARYDMLDALDMIATLKAKNERLTKEIEQLNRERNA